jgi:hypothetical protein
MQDKPWHAEVLYVLIQTLARVTKFQTGFSVIGVEEKCGVGYTVIWPN